MARKSTAKRAADAPQNTDAQPVPVADTAANPAPAGDTGRDEPVRGRVDPLAATDNPPADTITSNNGGA